MAAPYYNVGTASLTTGSDAMTGQGTLWVGNVRPGDQVVSYYGETAIVGSVNSNTSITLARTFRGASIVAGAYEIVYTPDDPFTRTLARQVLQSISGSALVGLGGVTPAARKLPYFDATGAAVLTDLSDFARTLLDDANGSSARSTLQLGSAATYDIGLAGPRTGLLNTVNQWDAIQVFAQMPQLPSGVKLIASGSNSSGVYARFSDGTQLCWMLDLSFGVVSSAFGNLYQGTAKSYNYPAIFSTGLVTGTVSDTESSNVFGTFSSSSTSTCSVQLWCGVSLGGSSRRTHVFATGRWF